MNYKVQICFKSGDSVTLDAVAEEFKPDFAAVDGLGPHPFTCVQYYGNEAQYEATIYLDPDEVAGIINSRTW